MFFQPDDLPWEGTWVIRIGNGVYSHFTYC